MHLDLVKDFTKEQIEYLKTLSKSELLELKSKLQTAASSNNTAQINRKLLINSLYGAMGNIYSRLYDLRNATAITLYGQLAIQWTARKVNESMNTMLKTSNVDYVTYADTDSVVGSTLIDVNGKQISIEDYYDSLSDANLVRNIPKDFVKSVSGDTSLGCDKEFNLVRKPIKYIMKHKVRKRMYKISANGKSVVVTEDHSIMISRNGKLLSAKPFEIIKDDEIILKELL